jgi:phage RecT family recombinase
MTDVQQAAAQQVAQPVKEHPLVVIRRFLDSRMAELKMALPPHISPERFIRVVITTIQKTPDIGACDRQSLWNACVMCAADGLLPNGEEAALVAYKAKAQYIPMYQGMLKKFRNSGEFRHVNTYVVYHDEPFEHWIDETGEHFKHVPGDERDIKKVRRVYATATTKDGGVFIADMSIGEVNKRRAMSRATRDDAPWEKWPEEMMRKTAIKALAKYLPRSSDIDALLQRDDAALSGVEAIEERRHAVAATDTLSALERFAQDDQPQQVVEQHTTHVDVVLDLFKAGAEAHHLGIPRDRPPGELRADNRRIDLQQWHEGWDSVGAS